MNKQHVGEKYSRHVVNATIVALVVGFLFLRSYFSIIAVSLILAYMYYPVYKYFLNKFSSSTAATFTIIINILSLIIPIAIILLITVAQSKTIINDVGSYFEGQSASNLLNEVLDPVNDFITDITGKPSSISRDDITDKVSEYASTLASFVLDLITGWVSSIGGIITNVILYIYIFMAALKYHKRLLDIVKSLNPLGDSVTKLYMDKAGAMTKGMVRGQFIIAVAQGVTSAIILTITGVPYGAFFALILSFLSLIPLGAGIVTLPIGFIRILMGDWWQGIVIILGHLLVVTNIDNVLRPILVPKEAYMNSALLLLSVFAGLATFGLLGIIVGPVIMVLVVSTIDIFQKDQKNHQPKKLQKSK